MTSEPHNLLADRHTEFYRMSCVGILLIPYAIRETVQGRHGIGGNQAHPQSLVGPGIAHRLWHLICRMGAFMSRPFIGRTNRVIRGPRSLL
jgi:hypothetical protein